MHRRRLLAPLAACTAIACALGVTATGAATADDDGRDLLRSGLVGSAPPAQGGPTLFGVAPGGAPWVVDHNSSVRIGDDGRVDLKIRGLVLTSTGQNSPTITTVTATVVCNGVPVALTGPAPIGLAGDARIRDRVRLPEPCLAPAVLVHPNSTTSRYIAANGS